MALNIKVVIFRYNLIHFQILRQDLQKLQLEFSAVDRSAGTLYSPTGEIVGIKSCQKIIWSIDIY
jgi:hypothetical protein